MSSKPFSTAPRSFQRGIQLICFSKVTSLIWASHPGWQAALGVTSQSDPSAPGLPFLAAIMLVTVIIVVALLWLMRQGRPWAIWTWTILTLLGSLSLVVAYLLVPEGTQVPSTHLKWLLSLLDLIGTALLWTPRARAHWRSAKPVAVTA